MRYLSVCSGIEAASVAWHHLGWTPVAFSEIEPFPAAVLAHRFPNVPNYGDMTQHEQWPLEPGSIDLLVGGTPCQSFSVAGLRKGISDPRGGLMLTYLEIARRLRPRWIVWENVPGVLSSGGGRDFGAFLGALGELGYGWAYRVLDAQWVRTQRHPRAVPQRRRRVFVVGCLGDWERAAQVLFERESVQRDSAPRRTQGEGFAADAQAGARAGCWLDGGGCAGTLTKQNAGGAQRMPDKDNFGAVLQPVGYRWQNDRDGLVEDGTAPACRASAGSSGFHEMNHPVVLARDNAAHAAVVGTDLYNGAITGDVAATMGTPGSSVNASGPTVMAFPIDGRNAMRDPDKLDEMNRQGMGIGDTGDPSHTVTAACVHGVAHAAVAHAFYSTGGTHGVNQHPEVSPAVKVGSGLGIPSPPAVAFNDTSATLKGGSGERGYPDPSDGNGHGIVGSAMTVRRLTSRECERLQGFPDDWTLIPWRKKPADECPDGPRYKALGNSMAVNCMAWIGERIAAVEDTHA